MMLYCREVLMSLQRCFSRTLYWETMGTSQHPHLWYLAVVKCLLVFPVTSTVSKCPLGLWCVGLYQLSLEHSWLMRSSLIRILKYKQRFIPMKSAKVLITFSVTHQNSLFVPLNANKRDKGISFFIKHLQGLSS